MSNLTCKVCDVDISHKIKGKYVPQFCSKKCQGINSTNTVLIEFTCQQCEETTLKKRSLIFKKGKTQKYCSPACTSLAIREAHKRVLTCEFCREDFVDKRGPSVGSKFCSNFCKHNHRYLSNRLVKDCLCCNKPFLSTLNQSVSNTYRSKYCSKSCKSGKPHPTAALDSFKKKARVHQDYCYVRVDGKKLLEHRYVMSQHKGRELYLHENVHHLNGDRSDNRLSNLQLWSKYQPAGQRVEDKVAYAKEIQKLYPEYW